MERVSPTTGEDCSGVAAMRLNKILNSLTWPVFAFGVIFIAPSRVLAHCDGLDGPVVKAAQRALDTGNPVFALIWVQANDETEIRTAFERTLAVRASSPQAKELADRFFLETLVCVHRAGKGSPFTGLKAAGRDLGPAIPAADKAIEEGSVESLVKLVTAAMQEHLARTLQRGRQRQSFQADNVTAGRAYVKATWNLSITSNVSTRIYRCGSRPFRRDQACNTRSLTPSDSILDSACASYFE